MSPSTPPTTITQRFQVLPTGEICGLQARNAKQFDLRALGKARVQRATEVMFNDEAQGWQVYFVGLGRWLVKTDAGCLLLSGKGCDATPHPQATLYDSYELAVQDEVRFIQGLDPKGEVYHELYRLAS